MSGRRKNEGRRATDAVNHPSHQSSPTPEYRNLTEYLLPALAEVCRAKAPMYRAGVGRIDQTVGHVREHEKETP